MKVTALEVPLQVGLEMDIVMMKLTTKVAYLMVVTAVVYLSHGNMLIVYYVFVMKI